MSNRLPSQEMLREYLGYDAETGIFIWIKEPRVIGSCLGLRAGTIQPTGYIFIGINGFGQLGAHRLAWIYANGEIPDGLEIDHIDGNPGNNRLANLRLATSSQQKQNKRVQSNNRSGLKGAFYHACRKGKKWRSQIKVGPDLIFLGYYATPEEAHAAYCKAARKYFGEFARTA